MDCTVFQRLATAQWVKLQRRQNAVQGYLVSGLLVGFILCCTVPTLIQGSTIHNRTLRNDLHRSNELRDTAFAARTGRGLGGEVVTALGTAAALATALSVAVSVATCLFVKSSCIGGVHKQKDDDDAGFAAGFNPDLLTIVEGEPVVINDQPLPVPGRDLPFDGCADGSVRFPNGSCLPVLKQGPCPPLHWVTVDPVTLEGICRPRLCGQAKVYVPRYQRCHDILDFKECPGGRRLYYTAYGDPICDCPTGQYPFPTPESPCVRLFTQGPCPPAQTVRLNRQGKLACLPADCRSHTNARRSWLSATLAQRPRSAPETLPGRQLAVDHAEVATQPGPVVRYQDGFCYALGTQGPCPDGETLGLDPLLKRVRCSDLLDPESPYEIKRKELGQLRANYSAWPVNYPDFVAVLWRENTFPWSRTNDDPWRDELDELEEWDRQDASAGVLQFPMLSPCRSGARNGNNFKCTNPVLSMSRNSALPQPTRPSLACGGGQVLVAAGECRASSGLGAGATGANSCGPSFNFEGGTCRQSLALRPS